MAGNRFNIEELVEKAMLSIRLPFGPHSSGADGIIYLLDDKVVLKLYREKNVRGSSQQSAEYVFELGTELHRQGIQVPEYFGIFQPTRLPKLNYWGVFMGRIKGSPLSKLNISDTSRALLQYTKQNLLIKKLGYDVEDSSIFNNTLFDTRQKKLFLYDILRWERK